MWKILILVLTVSTGEHEIHELNQRFDSVEECLVYGQNVISLTGGGNTVVAAITCVR